ncbi:MAG: hypothetical protein BWY89_01951 [Bacteroidetes bacterium ADurb.BinA012]|nr:MAG: hypothetical protein BWY89_01951 [Bacteroidetes bacterium ADurb.BinA012]
MPLISLIDSTTGSIPSVSFIFSLARAVTLLRMSVERTSSSMVATFMNEMTVCPTFSCEASFCLKGVILIIMSHSYILDGVSATIAPLSLYSLSVKPAACPAPLSMKISLPASVRILIASGVSGIRFSSS